MTGQTILVGVDGSTPSRAALHFAAAEADRRGAALRVLIAYEFDRPAATGTEELEKIARESHTGLVAEAVREAQRVRPALSVTGAAVPGDTVRVLLDASRRADMLVVGSRGLGGFASLLLGSVSQRVATHARGPVVVVRGEAEGGDRPVVVGVDGSAGAASALGVAFEEASVRRCALVPVHAYLTRLPPWTVGVPPLPYDTEAVKRAMCQELDATLAPWREKYPTVAVEPIVGPGTAGRILVDLSQRAALVVVGSRGHGGIAGTLLGSVGLQLLHHSACPVLIVHGQDGAEKSAA